MKKRLYRSCDGWIGGVCAGIAKHLDTDPTIVRIVFVLLSLSSIITFPGILVYLVLWALIPEEPSCGDSCCCEET